MVAALICLTSVAPMLFWRDAYPSGLLRYWLVGSAILTLVVYLDSRRGTDRPLAARLAEALDAPSRRAWLLAIASFAIGAGLLAAALVFAGGPSTPDEVSAYWHARVLLDGRLALPVDPNPEFFALETTVDVGAWYSQYPIGWPLVMTLGAIVDAPWVVGPLCLAGAVVLLHEFARRAYGDRDARVATILMIASPMVVLMAGTWMSHLPTTLLVCATSLSVLKWREAESLPAACRRAAVVGLLLAATFTVRPLDALALGAAVGSFQLLALAGDRRKRASLLVQGVVGAAALVPLLVVNSRLTGHPLRFGYDVIWGPAHRVGFHEDPFGELHTLSAGLENALEGVIGLNHFLLGWPLPAMLLLGVLVGLGRGRSEWDRFLLLLVFTQVAAYVAYWGASSFLGPRFLFSALPAILLLIARGPLVIGERWGRRAGTAVLMMFGLSIVVSWAAAFESNSSLALARQVAASRGSLRFDLDSLLAGRGIDSGVVFVREPLSQRLSRRLWGVGLARGDAAQFIRGTDVCSLLKSLTAVESEGLRGVPAVGALLGGTRRIQPGERLLPFADPLVRVPLDAPTQPVCSRELARDSAGVASFGPAFLSNAFGATGIEGPLVIAADLGDHNSALVERFGALPWYLLTSRRGKDGVTTPVLSELRAADSLARRD
jgi:hypothetical protein